jgi:type III secretion protein J
MTRAGQTIRHRVSSAARFGKLTLLLSCVALLGACSVPVATDLDERDANRAVSTLEQNNISSQKEPDPIKEGRWRIVVSSDDTSSAAAVLSRESLPPENNPGLLDALGDNSLVPSRTAEHSKWLAGTAGELERSLLGVDGVVSARVHLAVAAPDPLSLESEKKPPSASVLLRHRGATPPVSTGDVQRLIAGAVPNLTAENVSVVMASAPRVGVPKERELSRFGPITVTRSSVLPLRALVGGVAVLNLVLIGLVVGLWSKIRRTRTLLDSRETEAREGS